MYEIEKLCKKSNIIVNIFVKYIYIRIGSVIIEYLWIVRIFNIVYFNIIIWIDYIYELIIFKYKMYDKYNIGDEIYGEVI